MAEIRADLVGDSRDFTRAVDKGTESVEDLSDELKDLGKTGDRELDGLTDKLNDLPKAARNADKALEGVGTGAKKGTHAAGQSVAEFKDEAKQNFGEVASSFSGDMAASADLVQGTLGGLAASIGGPLGLALGAASIALGAVIAQAQADAEKAEELRLQAIEAVKSAFEEGVDVSAFLSSADQVAERIQTLEESKEGTNKRWFWEEDPSRLEEWADALKVLGRETSEVGDVLESDTKSLKKYRDAIEDSQDAISDQLGVLQRRRNLGETVSQEEVRNLTAQADAYDDLLKNVESEIDLRDAAADSATRQGDAGLDAALKAAQAEEDAVRAAEDAAARRESIAESVADSATSMYDSIRDAAVGAATSEEGVFDLSKWLNLVAESKAQADAYKANLAQLKLTPEQWENYLSLPEETRASIAQSYVVADESTRTSIVSALTDSGTQAGTGAAVAFDESFNPEADVEVSTKVDTKGVTAALEKVARGSYTATVKVRGDSSLASVRTALTGLTRARVVPVSAQMSTQAAQDALDRFIRRNTGRKVDLYARILDPNTRQPI
jgi:hypothetical protein